MVLTDAEKLAISTTVLRGEEFILRDTKIFPLNGGGFCVQKLNPTGEVQDQVTTKYWSKALSQFELYADPEALHAYTARIVLSEVTIITSSAERAEELAMEIFESDARTQLTHGLCVEYVEVEDAGPSLDDETEVS